VSIEAVAIALHHSKARGTAKIVLLGIANHDGDGGSFPKVATLAKYANVHPRRVTDALATLGELGEVIIHQNDGGTHRTPSHVRPNLYEFVLTCPDDCDRTKHHRIQDQKIGRSYRGQYDDGRTPDPVYVERGKTGRAKSLEAVENAALPPSDENSTSAENSTTPSAENSTTKNHKIEPPIEDRFVGTSPAIAPAVDNLPPRPPAVPVRNDAAGKTTSTTDPLGLTPEQMSRNRSGAALARAALRGELTFNEAKDDKETL
jgi:hypothetical protein